MGAEKALARRLTEERRAIRVRLSRMVRLARNEFLEGRQLSGGHSHDALEEAQQGFQRESEAETYKLLSSRAKALDHAWNELKQGTYGVCRLCGAQIPRNRLEAMPGATLCVSCQAMIE